MASQHPELTPLDYDVLRLLVRAGYARPDSVVAFTGASPYGVRKAFRRLRAAEMVRTDPVALDLLDSKGTLRSTIATAWTATGRGAKALAPHQVPGTDLRVALTAPKTAPSMARHTCGVSWLAGWYRRAGYEIAFEREVNHLERPNIVAGQRRQVVSSWTVAVPGLRGVHPPDLGAVDVDGRRWAVELERKTATVQEYRDLIIAYRAAGIGQVWHVLHQATGKRIVKGAQLAGVQWGESPERGVNSSTDGLFRIQGWLPSRVLAGPETWAYGKNFPVTAPAALPTFPVHLDTWRAGTGYDLDAEPLWEPLEMIDAAA